MSSMEDAIDDRTVAQRLRDLAVYAPKQRALTTEIDPGAQHEVMHGAASNVLERFSWGSLIDTLVVDSASWV